MPRYEKQKDLFRSQRLGSFERQFGDNGAESAQDLVASAGSAQEPAATSSTAAVLTGVGAILNPLAQAGVGIFQATQQAKLEKARLKAEMRSQPQITPEMLAAMMSSRPAPQSSSLPLILGIIGGLSLLGIVFFVVTKK